MTSAPSNPSAPRDTRGRFRPGASGNPRGRLPGQPDRRSRFRQLLEQHAEPMIQRAVKLALEGDREMLSFCLGRIIPAPRPLDERASLSVAPDATLAQRVEALTRAALDGTVTPGVALALAKTLEVEGRVAQLTELSDRLAALESKFADDSTTTTRF